MNTRKTLLTASALVLAVGCDKPTPKDKTFSGTFRDTEVVIQVSPDSSKIIDMYPNVPVGLGHNHYLTGYIDRYGRFERILIDGMEVVGSQNFGDGLYEHANPDSLNAACDSVFAQEARRIAEAQNKRK